ncbi:MAG: hypothetical protein HYT93_03230 [Parcubacteria group bacterium]|nr:hypothetical protein [Parcubacteria group bacterium]
MESTIVGFILLVAGGLMVVRPDILIQFQIWTQRVIMGAKYEPSQRTYNITRFIGVIFVLLGFLAIVGFIE